jgi:hypothetical protein
MGDPDENGSMGRCRRPFDRVGERTGTQTQGPQVKSQTPPLSCSNATPVARSGRWSRFLRLERDPRRHLQFALLSIKVNEAAVPWDDEPRPDLWQL